MIPRPAITAPPAWSFPIPEVTSLDSGLRLWAYDLPGQCILSCYLVLELPLNAEPVDREGVATVAVRSLDEGTLVHPGPDYVAALDDVGAQFSGQAGLSTTQCFLNLPYDSLEPGLALLAEAVIEPAFAPPDVARVKANRLAEIDQHESRGSFLASTALRRIVLDTGLRASRPSGGTQQGVAAIQTEDVVAFHTRCYQPESGILIIAGDLSEVSPVDAATKAFGAWDPTGSPVPPEPARPGTVSRQLIHRPGAVQADIRFGWYGIDRRDPRWASLQVGLTIMGGSFGSRLNTMLREQRGFTYGVAMTAHPFRSGGVIDISAATRGATASDLIGETLAILQASQPFSAAEVRDSVGYLTMSAPLCFDTAEAVASQATSLAAARLDLDHVSKSLAELNKVTPDSAMEAYRSLIQPDQASIVVVADTSEITGDLLAHGF